MQQINTILRTGNCVKTTNIKALNNAKMNPSLGLSAIPNSATVRRNANKPVQKLPNKYVNSDNRIMCVPAIRQELTEWSELNMNGLDTQNLTVETILTTFYLHTHGMLQFGGSYSTNFKFGHTIYRTDKDRYYPERKSVYLDESSDRGFIRKLSEWLHKNGGINKLLAISSAKRYDAIGYLVSNFEAEPCGRVPVVRCGCCNMVNILSYADSKTGSPESHKLHTAGPYWDDSNILKIVDGIAPWQCGYCLADLDIIIDQYNEDFFFNLIENNIWHYIGGDLDKLGTIGVMDAFADADENIRNKIIQHDLAVFRNSVRNLATTYIPIGHDLPEELTKTMSKLAGNAVMKPSYRNMSNHPELLAEMMCAQTIAINKYVTNTPIMLVGATVTTAHDNIHYKNYNNWISTPDRVKKCCQKDECAEKFNQLIFGMGALSNDLETIVKTCELANGCYVVVPNTEKNLWKTKVNNNITYMMTNNIVNSIKFNTNTLMALTNSDVIGWQEKYYKIKTILVLNYCKLVHISLSTSLNIKNTIHVHQPQDVIMVRMPTFNHLLPQNLQFLLTNKKEIELNIELYNTLCRRDLLANMSYDSLVEFGVGWALTRYSTMTTVIKRPNVTSEQVQVAALFAKLTMERMRQTFNYDENALRWFRKTGPFTVMLTKATERVYQTARKTIADFVSDTLKFPITDILKCLELPNVSSWLEEFENNNDLTTILDLRKQKSHSRLRVCYIATEEQNIVTNHTQCSHHNFSCTHEGSRFCKCCYQPCEAMYCSCCTVIKEKSTMKLTAEAVNVNTAAVKPITTYTNELGIECIPAKRECKPLEGDKHQHLCSKCNKEYTHEHHYNYTLHPLFVGDCPWCEPDHPNSKKSTKVEPNVKTVASEQNMLPSFGQIQQMAANEDNLQTIEDPLFKTDLELQENLLQVIGPGKMYVARLMQGEHLFKPFVNILNDYTPSPSPGGRCALDAIEYITTDKYEDKDLQHIGINTDWMTTNDLAKFSEHTSINLMIIHQDFTTILKNNETEETVCILFTGDTTAGHYSVPSMELSRRPNYYKSIDFNIPVEWRLPYLQAYNYTIMDMFNETQITTKTNETIETLVKSTTIDFSSTGFSTFQFGWHTKEGVKYLANNQKCEHNPQRALISFETEGKIGELLIQLNLDHKTILNMAKFNKPLNREKRIPINAEDEIINLLTEQIKMIKTVEAEQHKAKSNSVYKTFLRKIKYKTTNKISTLSLKHQTLKPGDWLSVTVDGVRAIKSVILTTDSYVLTEALPKNKGVCDVDIFKVSMGSALLKLYQLATTPKNTARLTQLLKTAEVHLGVPGSGKSRTITEKASAGDMVVSKTRAGYSNVKPYLSPGVSTMSVEKLSYLQPQNIQNLFIDECTMMDWTEMLCLTKHTITKLYLFGGPNQIGNVDMYHSGGLRLTQNITDYVTEAQITEHKKSGRIGNPAAGKIRELVPTFDTEDTHETVLNVTNINLPAAEKELLALIKRTQPDIILTFYNSVKAMLADMLAKQKLKMPVETVHRVQANEYDKVVAIYMADVHTNKFDIPRDKQYLYSIITRAKELTELVVVNYPNIVENLSELTEYKGGLLEQIPPDLSFNTMDRDNETKNTLIQMGTIHDNDKKFSFTPTVDGIRCHIQMPHGEAEVVKEKNKTTVTGNFILKQIIYNNLDTPWYDYLSDNIYADNKTHTVPTNVDVHKVRKLAWMVDMQLDCNLPIKYNKGMLQIVKTSGCPLMAGITIQTYEQTPVIEISHGYNYGKPRTLVNHGGKNYEPLEAWFSTSRMIGKTNTWLDDIPTSKQESDAMLKERLSNAFGSMWDTLISRATKGSYTRLEQKVFNEYKALCKNIRHPVNLDRQSVIPHEIYMDLQLGIFYGNIRICDRQGVIITNKFTYQELATQLNKAYTRDLAMVTQVRTIKPIPLISKYIGAKPTYIIPLVEHVNNKTTIGLEAIRLQLKTKLLKQPQIMDNMNIPDIASKYIDKIKTSTGVDIPCNNIVNTNEGITGYKYVQETVNLNMFGIKGKDMPITYGGPHPSLLITGNKPYIKILHKRAYERYELFLNTNELDTVKTQLHNRNTFTDNKEINLSYIEKLEKPENLVLGMNLMYIPTEHLFELLDQTASISGSIPSNEEPNNEYFSICDVDNNLFYSEDNEGLAHKLNKQLYYCANSGKPIIHKDRMIVINIQKTLLNMLHVTVSKTNIPNTYVYLSTNHVHHKEIVEVSLPYINTNINEILKSDTLFVMQKYSINAKLYRMMRLRLLTGDDDMNSLLTYTRTLASTQVASADYINMKTDVHIPSLYATALVAKYMHDESHLSIGKLVNLISTMTKNQFIMKHTQEIIVALFNTISGLQEVAKVIGLETIFNKFKNQINIGRELLDKSNVYELRMLIDEEESKIIELKTVAELPGTETETTHNADDDSDYESDLESITSDEELFEDATENVESNNQIEYLDIQSESDHESIELQNSDYIDALLATMKTPDELSETPMDDLSDTILVLGNGSYGDLLPLVKIAQLLDSVGAKVLIATHDDHIKKLPNNLNHKTIVSDWKASTANAIITLGGLAIADNKTSREHLQSKIEFSKIMEWPITRFRAILTTPITPCQEFLGKRFNCPVAYMSPFNLVDGLQMRPKQDIKTNILMGINFALDHKNKDFDKFVKAKGWGKFQRDTNVWTDDTDILITNSTDLCVDVNPNCTYVGPLSTNSKLTKLATPPVLTKPYCVVTFGSLANSMLLNIMLKIIEKLATTGLHTYVVGCGLYDALVEPHTYNLHLKKRAEDHQITIEQYVDYDHYLPEATFALAHGGVGTIQQMIKHKCPLLCWPIFGDQFLNGRLLAERNLGLHHEANCKYVDDLDELLTTMLTKHHEFKVNYLKTTLDLNLDEDKLLDWLNRQMNVKPLVQKLYINHKIMEHLTKHRPSETVTNLIPGMYNTAVPSMKLFDPTKPNNCVMYCFEQFIAGLQNNHPDIELEGKWSDFMNEDNIIDNAFINGLNISITENGNAKLHVFHSQWNTIWIRLETRNLLTHCVLMEPPETIDALRLTERSITDYKEDLDGNGTYCHLNVHFEELTKGVDSQEFKALCSNHRNIAARLNTKQYLLIYQRTLRPLFLVADTTHPQIKIITTSIQNMDDVMVTYIDTEHNLQAGIVLKGHIQHYVLLLSGKQPLGHFMFNMAIKFLHKASRNVPATLTNRYYAMNTETKTILETRKKYLQLAPIKLIKGDVLIIEHYDNRTHHTRNYDLFGHNAYAILWNKALTKKDLEEIKATHNKPINRRCLIQGQVKYAFESSNKNLTQALVKLLRTNNRKTKTIGTSTYYDHKIDEAIVSYTNPYVKEQQFIVTSKNLSEWETTAEQQIINTVLDTFGIKSTADLRSTLATPLSEREAMTLLKTGWVISKDLGPSQLLVLSTGESYIPQLTGGAPSIPENRVSWKFSDATHDETKFIIAKTEQGRTDLLTPVWDVTALNLLNLIEDPNIHVEVVDGVHNDYEPVYTQPLFNKLHELEGDVIDVPNDAVIELWEDTDLTTWLQINAPKQGIIMTREQPTKIIKFTKATLTKYPIMSRPVLSKIVFDEQRAIAQRLHGMENIRIHHPKPNIMLNKICRAWFHDKCWQMIQDFVATPLSYSATGTTEWLASHPKTNTKYKDLIKSLAGELETKPFNDVNVHAKMESLLKTNPISSWDQHKSRLIVWQEYVVAAIFSPIFTEAKTRLKALLNDKIVYADGLQPYEIAALTRNVNNVKYFMENDLTLQDKQTDKPLLDTEMLLYKMLGVNENVLSVWRNMHANWRYKGKFNRGMGTQMRQSGQATTALGNFITNIQVHADFKIDNTDRIQLTLVLGDDILFFLNAKVNIQKLRGNIAANFNMLAKDDLYEHHGTFCRLVAHKTRDGQVGMGPDFIRLKNRYEVTNGLSEANDENIKLRTLSYCCMIGKLPQTDELVRELGFDINLEHWYEYPYLAFALAHKYNISEEQVEANLMELIRMMKQRNVYKTEFRAYGNK
nr:polyprotein [Grapevine endornavirus 2]